MNGTEATLQGRQREQRKKWGIESIAGREERGVTEGAEGGAECAGGPEGAREENIPNAQDTAESREETEGAEELQEAEATEKSERLEVVQKAEGA